MHSIREPFVVDRPVGARIRTRLRLTAADYAVLVAVGEHLGRLAGADLAWRCRQGWEEDQRAARKRVLTAGSSSRWAGAITRTANDQCKRALANLADHRIGLHRAIHTTQTRLAVPVGQRQGHVRGYATRAERFAKQCRLQHLQAELAEVNSRLAAGRVSVCRGGRRLAKQRHALEEAKLTRQQWRAHWQAERLFLTADGEAAKRWGNETIRVHPNQQWLELRLPTPLAHLSNIPGRAAAYRLACPVRFTHRADEWVAQVATGAVRYDISYNPGKGRWYLAASWRLPAIQPPSLAELRRDRAVGVDLNADHLACWVLDACGNPTGPPHTIPLELTGLPASTRDGRLRMAITATLRLAKATGCRSIVVENLNFADARQVGRETLGRGRRGKRFRKVISGIPTRRFRDVLVGMAANQGLWVLAIDPAWTSRWGQRYWQLPLNQQTKSSIAVTRHHAAAVVIGRRGLGYRARRRSGVPGHDRRIVAGELPARLATELRAVREPDPLEAVGQRHRPLKTRRAEQPRSGDQVVQDRSGPPEQGPPLLTS